MTKYKRGSIFPILGIMGEHAEEANKDGLSESEECPVCHYVIDYCECNKPTTKKREMNADILRRLTQ